MCPQVASPTPRKQNNCPTKPTIPPPPEGLLINEFNGPNCTVGQCIFVELIGPPLTPLNGLVLVFFGEDAQAVSVPLRGSTGTDGLYLIGNVSNADQGLPALDQSELGAVLLCYEPSGSGVYGKNSHSLDWLVFTADPKIQHILQHNTTRLQLMLFSSLSRCASDGPVLWVPSQETPGLQNLCPRPALSSSVDVCLQRKSGTGNCDQEELADLLESLCYCGITSLHVKGVNVSCEAGVLDAQGPVLAVTDQQRERITASLNDNKLSCSPASRVLQVHGAGAPVALQVGLVLAALLLFALGVVLFLYLYKKRRPADYLSMQLSEQVETPLEL
ncbi:hypothetical protein F2P79_008636 [Pimephales promelas]|nr:hypothetical protein F2P79_008636 [Pimephales promelas]KAG1955645.1 hypothetical protein F2P79_008636 [Pimephales promelas]